MKIQYSEENNKYIKAKKRVDELKGFYWHLATTVFVIPMVIFINYMTSWGFQWFWFPLFGMLISIIIHSFVVFGYNKEWEDRKVRELMGKDNF